MAHVVVLVTEFQRNEGVESARTVLQVAQTVHMIDPVRIGLDVTV
jgi:hypothetical protein